MRATSRLPEAVSQRVPIGLVANISVQLLLKGEVCDELELLEPQRLGIRATLDGKVTELLRGDGQRNLQGINTVKQLT